MGLAEVALLCAFFLGQNVPIEIVAQLNPEMNLIGSEHHAPILHEYVILSREVGSSFIVPVAQSYCDAKRSLVFHTSSHLFGEENRVNVPFIVTDDCGEGAVRPIFQPLYQCAVGHVVFSSAARVELAKIFAVTRDKVADIFDLEVGFSIATGHGIKGANIVQRNIDPWSLAKSLQIIRFDGGVGSGGSFVSGLSSGDVGLPSEKESRAKTDHAEQSYQDLPSSQINQFRRSLGHLPLLAQVGLVLVYGGVAYGLIAYGAGFKPAKVWAVAGGFVLLALLCVMVAAP